MSAIEQLIEGRAATSAMASACDACCWRRDGRWSDRSSSSTTWGRPTSRRAAPSTCGRIRTSRWRRSPTRSRARSHHRDSSPASGRDPSGRRQLDGRGPRHRALERPRRAQPRARDADARHPVLGGAAGRARGRCARVPPPSGRDAAGAADARRCAAARDRGRGLRPSLAGRDGVADALRRRGAADGRALPSLGRRPRGTRSTSPRRPASTAAVATGSWRCSRRAARSRCATAAAAPRARCCRRRAFRRRAISGGNCRLVARASGAGEAGLGPRDLAVVDDARGRAGVHPAAGRADKRADTALKAAPELRVVRPRQRGATSEPFGRIDQPRRLKRSGSSAKRRVALPGWADLRARHLGGERGPAPRAC